MDKKLIDRQVVVDRVTDKYIYSTEHLTYVVTEFFVAVHPHERKYGGWHGAGFSGTVYHSMDDAKAAIEETAKRWGWDSRACYIKVNHATHYEMKHHRNKVKG